MNTCAFFDIDGTFYRDSLLTEHFKRLIKYEVISPTVWDENVKETFHEWDNRQGDYDDFLLEITETYVKHLTGIAKDEIDFIARQVIRLKADRVYKYTRQQINWHQEQGHKILFISGSPSFLVSKMAEKYNATDYCGSTYHIDENGFFSGNVTPMWDSNSKEKAIHKMVEKHNIDLTKSYAYGDTNGDVTMFKHVAHPVAINPSKELLGIINTTTDLKKKTEIIIERKDVIYKINPMTREVIFC
ncbi:HAD family hydrolase [Bacillus sp. FJAT-45350]|uniref:HAD family hydrolase n=1 Tax=Bacillus sp. FJAT-45350 TaxID=2011014 RepID=UPI000BB90F88|nr:HAD-IB family hydrolase [Bacillus sp. FJAT-45350]